MPTNLILAGVISGQKKWTESNSKDTVYLHIFYTSSDKFHTSKQQLITFRLVVAIISRHHNYDLQPINEIMHTIAEN